MDDSAYEKIVNADGSVVIIKHEHESGDGCGCGTIIIIVLLLHIISLLGGC